MPIIELKLDVYHYWHMPKLKDQGHVCVMFANDTLERIYFQFMLGPSLEFLKKKKMIHIQKERRNNEH